jgi:hypothetical protein
MQIISDAVAGHWDWRNSILSPLHGAAALDVREHGLVIDRVAFGSRFLTHQRPTSLGGLGDLTPPWEK